MHQSVLLEEAVHALAIQPNGIYVDATFGRGGHSLEILKYLGDAGRLIVIDKDLEAIAYAKQKLAQDPRVTSFHGSFAEIERYARQTQAYGQINGILVDLGVSSPQLDEADRGFSFMKEGPLDMRMNAEQTLDAATFVNQASEEMLAQVFYDYGEERFSRRIAAAIVKARQLEPIASTQRLAEIVKAANPRWEKHKHPATRVFQAIRIYVNEELKDLQHFLQTVCPVLAIGGRLVVISFHSLEDRIVKTFMRQKEEGPQLPAYIPVQTMETQKQFKRIGKAIKPGEQEIRHNPRARSAVLRIGEKLS